MRVKNSPPSLYLASIHGGDRQKLYLSSISGDNREILVREVPRKIRGKNFRAACEGWILVWGEDDTDYFLWNPLTEKILTLPDLDLKPESKISSRILTSAPGNPNSMVILYEMEEPALRYCRIGDKFWSTEPIPSSIGSSDEAFCRLENFVTCNGKIYCCTVLYNELVVIDIKRDGLAMSILHRWTPRRRDTRWDYGERYLVESCGELFVIFLLINESKHRERPFASVGAVDMFRFDFSLGEWVNVESFYDRAFFLGPSSHFSCPATQPGIRGNRVYFHFHDHSDCSFYVFNMEDKTVLFSSPCQNLAEPWLTSFWIMSDSRPSDLSRESKKWWNLVGFFLAVIYKVLEVLRWWWSLGFQNNWRGRGASLPLSSALESEVDTEDSGEETEIESDNGEDMKLATLEGDLGIFNLDIQLAIASCLGLADYFRFRAVNSLFRSMAPPNRWTSSVFKAYEICDSSPQLMFWEVGSRICNFIDPLSDERYFVRIPHSGSKNVLFYSKGGWSVVLQGEYNISFWNPFSKTVIPLPEIVQSHCVSGCSFSSSPDSPKSDCVVVLLVCIDGVFWIDYTYLGGDSWRSYSFKFNGIKLHKENYPVFFDGAIYFLDGDGKLGVFREADDIQVDADGDTVLNHVLDSPCELLFHQKFLLECDGKLLSVFVGFLGRFIHIFKLDESNMVWLEVESLGNHTLYLSRYSSFSARATQGMQNRIYLNRFYGKSIVYYSLDSKQLHSHATGEVFENFYSTKELLLCGWLSPSF